MAEDQIRCVHKHRGVRFFRATTAFNASWQRSTGWTPQNEDGSLILAPAKLQPEKKNVNTAISENQKADLSFSEPIPFVEFEGENTPKPSQKLGRPRKQL